MAQVRLLLSLLILLSLMAFTVKVVTDQTWKTEQLMKPSDLAARINSNNLRDLAIFNIGPVDQIKGAKQAGSASDQRGLARLKELASRLNRDKKPVIYCGCCSTNNCPNLKPAYEQLNAMGFKGIRILDFQHSLQADWISKGYPME